VDDVYGIYKPVLVSVVISEIDERVGQVKSIANHSGTIIGKAPPNPSDPLP